MVDRAHWRDRFNAGVLVPSWEMMRTPTQSWYRTGEDGLTLLARPVSISGSGNPSFLGQRQRHEDAVLETELRYRPRKIGDAAGLVGLCR